MESAPETAAQRLMTPTSRGRLMGAPNPPGSADDGDRRRPAPPAGGAGGDAAKQLGDSQRRSLSVGLRHLAELLDEVERVLVEATKPSSFRNLSNDLSPAEERRIRDHVERARRVLLEVADRHGLDAAGPSMDARRSIYAYLTAALIGVAELRAGRLRAYGALAEEVGEQVDRSCDELERILQDLQAVVTSGAE
jgi:hypothetical protein